MLNGIFILCMSTGALPQDLAGLAAVVLLLGVRHGFDADHLATIDGLTHAGIVAHPRWARACGALFSLGHGTVVVAVALTISQATVSWKAPDWLTAFGAWISIAFLIALGLMNIASVLRTAPDQIVLPTGLRHRLLRHALGGPAYSRTGNPIWAFPIGTLFAISFDTVSQAAMFSAAASRHGAWKGALCCALLFTVGLLLTDGMNGLWISHLLRRSGSTARIASRVMGLGVGGASLLIAAIGILRRTSESASEWLDDREVLLGTAVIVIVLFAFVVALRLVAGQRRGTVTVSGEALSRL